MWHTQEWGEKTEGRRSLERLMHRWKDNIKTNLKNINAGNLSLRIHNTLQEHSIFKHNFVFCGIIQGL
jgi:hypothetical protein